MMLGMKERRAERYEGIGDRGWMLEFGGKPFEISVWSRVQKYYCFDKIVAWIGKLISYGRSVDESSVVTTHGTKYEGEYNLCHN